LSANPEVNKKYQIIYADPPWEWKTYSQKGREKTPDKHYPLMDIADLNSLPIDTIVADDCVLFMWTQDAHLKNAISLGEAWGFTFKTIGFVWDKQNFGMGYWTRKGAEICLLFTKGHPKRLDAGVRQFISERATEHSKKPSLIRNRIVKLMGDIPRVELFARQKTEGWDVWGNEVECDIDLTKAESLG
jgi:N6-adenosine-specific RNA methylase IME4